MRFYFAVIEIADTALVTSGAYERNFTAPDGTFYHHILDPETAGKVTGARFHFYRGLGARLERAVINYYLDTHTENGYTDNGGDVGTNLE